MFETVASILSTGLSGTCLAVIVTLRRLRQNDRNFKVSLGYMASFKPTVSNEGCLFDLHPSPADWHIFLAWHGFIIAGDTLKRERKQ